MLFNYTEIHNGIMVKRPSRICKSPYVADVLIHNIDIDSICPQNTILCHSPSLGCNGLIDKNTNLLLTKIGENNKCKYRIEFVMYDKLIIGTNPYLSNKIVFDMITENYFQSQELYDFKYLKTEYKINNSRFDIYGEKNDKKYYIEIKTAPVKIENDIAVFPKGFRKSKNATISERANKHLRELMELSVNDNCYIIYHVPRNDCKYFTANFEDKEYSDLFKLAIKSNVKIIAFSSYLDIESKCIKFDKFLKILMPNNNYKQKMIINL